ncbi:hypothetical protein KPH14_012965, partial [Odynerus spinipes]
MPVRPRAATAATASTGAT